MTNPQQVLDFWYSDEVRSRWFKSTPEFDAEIRKRFESYWQAAAEGRLNHWLDEAESCLALIIVLDQFPLNMYRGLAESFATEAQAIAATYHAVASDYPSQIERSRLSFMLMPLMHSEKLQDQEMAVTLFEKYQLNDNLRFAKHHHDIVHRFGRFPHRNAILGRQSTTEENDYLNSKQAFKG